MHDECQMAGVLRRRTHAPGASLSYSLVKERAHRGFTAALWSSHLFHVVSPCERIPATEKQTEPIVSFSLMCTYPL